MRITVNKCLPPGQKKTIFETFGGGGLPERPSNVLEGGLLCEGTYSFIKIIENFILIKTLEFCSLISKLYIFYFYPKSY